VDTRLLFIRAFHQLQSSVTAYSVLTPFLSTLWTIGPPTLLQILLMILLRRPEGHSSQAFRGNLPPSVLFLLLLKPLARDLLLLIGMEIDAGAVLRPAIASLSVDGERIDPAKERV